MCCMRVHYSCTHRRGGRADEELVDEPHVRVGVGCVHGGSHPVADEGVDGRAARRASARLCLFYKGLG